MAAVLKYWTGSAWVAKPLKVWNGSAWVAKPLKFWNGSAWIGPPAGGIVAPTFVALGNTNYSTRSVLDIPKPAGVALNSIVLAGVFMGFATAPGNISGVPTGFTQIGTYAALNDGGGFQAKFSVWWKRATASEPGTYDFTFPATYNSQGFTLAYNGCPTAGSPIDVSSQNNANTGSTATGTGVTTTQANDILVWLGHNWDGSGTLTPPSGMTERFDSLCYASDQVIAAAGATGNRTQTQAASNPWTSFLVALKGI